MHKKVNKTALINSVLKAEIHNRLQEEQEMWKQHEAKTSQNLKRTSKVDSHSSFKKTKHSQEKNSSHKSSGTGTQCKNYICTVATEERWGHLSYTYTIQLQCST